MLHQVDEPLAPEAEPGAAWAATVLLALVPSGAVLEWMLSCLAHAWHEWCQTADGAGWRAR